ncbi:ABC transporter permease [Jiangella endophytica]|uniref:ABC transporter permease n=1 Tax=Jiangella endophytica TaxID=1623398 RepID=UPI000E34D584|nr:ABC transporter permease [Jiangella endophytica]
MSAATLPSAVTERRSTRIRSQARPVILRVVSLAALLTTWQLAGTETGLGFPSFTRTLSTLGDLVTTPAFWTAVWGTNQALLLGFALALAVAVPLAIAMGRSRLVTLTVRPYLSVLIAVPVIAFLPVIQIVFGLSLAARVIVVFLFAFAYIAVNGAVGVRSTDPSLVEMARSFGASRLAVLREVVLPAAVPAFMTGIRVGLGQALIGMVVAELALVGAGIGSLITDAQGRFDVTTVLAITLVIVIEGILLLTMVGAVERRLSSWNGART